VSVKVKICGITNLEDALAAADAGADYLGFIFFPPSKRFVEPQAVRDIVRELRQRPEIPLLVGVFVDETAAFMMQVLDDCDLDFAQLSGQEVPWLVGDKASPLHGRAYKGIQPASRTEAEVEAEWYAVPDRADLLPSLLLDSYHPTLRGGTGETGDWEISAKLAKVYPGFMLAGGLTPDNVGEAVQQVRPFAVDVASGVEAQPGKKDYAKVSTFIANAKAVG
jgi:phosphoribosylanthranilate isomerase